MLKIVASHLFESHQNPPVTSPDLTAFPGQATLVLTKDAEHRMSRVLLRKS